MGKTRSQSKSHLLRHKRGQHITFLIGLWFLLYLLVNTGLTMFYELPTFPVDSPRC